MADYFSFEDVLQELELGEEELKRMVSEGELRAFRDQNKMKFRKEDVESLKKGRETEPTLILPSDSNPNVNTAETLLDLETVDAPAGGQEDTSLEILSEGSSTRNAASGEETGGMTEPMELVPDDLKIADDSQTVSVESQDTFIEEGEDTGLTTEPLQLADDGSTEVTESVDDAAVPTIEQPEGDVAEEAELRRPRRPSRRSGALSGSVAMVDEDALEARRAGPVWTVLIGLALIIVTASGFFFYDLLRLQTTRATKPLGMTGNMASRVLTKFFYGDAKYKEYGGFNQMPGEWQVVTFPQSRKESEQLIQSVMNQMADKAKEAAAQPEPAPEPAPAAPAPSDAPPVDAPADPAAPAEEPQ